jgi:putative spermidine/putrescine transport system permease protein
MISQLIAIQMEKQLNWGLAGALSAYLVVITIAIYVAFSQLMGVDRLKMG